MSGKGWAKIIGVILLLVGVLGFFTGDSVLGFMVNPQHNIVHLLTGLIFAIAGFGSGSAKGVNTWLGIIYIVVAILGFFVASFASLLAINTADSWLHLVIGIISTWVGVKSA